MQNARVIQLGSSGVKVTRQSASFEEAFGGYSNKRKDKFSNASGDVSANLKSLYNFRVKGDKGNYKNFAKDEIISTTKNGVNVYAKIGDETFWIDPSFLYSVYNNTTVLGKPINPSNDNATIKSDMAKYYKPLYDLKSVGSLGTIKYFPKGVDVLGVRTYKQKSNGVNYDIKVIHTAPNGEIFEILPDFVQTVGTNANALGKIIPTVSSENMLLDFLVPLTNTSTDNPNSGGGSTGTSTNPPLSALTQMLTTLTAEKLSRYTTDKPLEPLFQGFYKVVNDVYGLRDASSLTKKFLKDEIVEGYLQTFDNPTTGVKSGYWVVKAEVPTTVGNASTTTASTSNNPSNAPVNNYATSTASSGTATGTATSGGTASGVGTSSGTSTGTQTSANPNAIPQAKSSATGMTMVNFKLPLYALVPAPFTSGGNTDPNTGGGTNQDGFPTQGGGTNQGGGVYTGGESSSDALDQLNAQIGAQQLADYQQQGGGQQQAESGVNPYQAMTPYNPSQDELMVDVDTNYAPDTDVESSFDGFSNSNAMETKINDLASKIAWNKEKAEMLKMKKGVDKTALKEEYMKTVARVNELLKELKGCETPANREYILKMIAECDMMRPSMKNKMKKNIVIQNANPKIIDLGNATPSEFKNDLGNTIMENEDSSFMGDVIEYSDFSGSSTTTALMGVGIGAVLGIIGIVVINKMKK